jgi:hypothetical protein
MRKKDLTNYRGKYRCDRCNFTCNNLDELDEHKEYNHGVVSKERHLQAKDSVIHRIYTKYYLSKGKPKSYYKEPPDDKKIIFGGNLESKDGVLIGYYYVWNDKTHEYEMRTSWGSKIVYKKEIGSFIPVDIWNKYLKKRKEKDLSDYVFEEFQGGD